MKTRPLTLASLILALLLAAALTACSSAPRTPDWQIEAKGALDRTIAAYLTGNTRVEQAEMAHTRQQLASTGRADLAAAAELRYCAARVASLVWEACAGFDTLRQDATPAQRAYADYLQGQMSAATVALPPPPQRAAATRTDADGSALQNMEDPLSLLVAAGVLLQTGKANPAIIEQAVAAASAQGWRRPLLAWLGVQLQRAKQAGQTEEAERISRRIALVQGS
jgi:hypothetical protein